MKEKVNIAVIENPAILLNTIEAMHYYKIPYEQTVVAVTSAYGKNISMLKRILQRFNFQKVHYLAGDAVAPDALPLKGGARIWQLFNMRRQADKLAKSLGYEVDIFISGFYANDFSLHFSSLLNKQRYILVDDGNMTLFTAKGREKERAIGFDHVYGVNSITEYKTASQKLNLWIKRNLVGIKDKGTPTLQIFSSHDIAPTGNDQAAKNHYACLSASIESKSQNSSVYLLGAPILENNLMNRENWEWMCRQLAIYFAGKEVIYFPHRFEGKETLDILQALTPFSINTDGLPIELFISQAEELPQKISSFYSSALTNLHSLCKSRVNIEAIVIPDEMVADRSKAKLIADIYRNFKDKEDQTFKVTVL